MKMLSEKIRAVALVILLSFGLGACSTGTDPGATNVEESDAKDKNPTEHNASASQPTATDTGSVQKMDDAYERTDGDKGARDKDNDGQVDK